jgi:hypothetical protein
MITAAVTILQVGDVVVKAPGMILILLFVALAVR